MVKSNSSRNNNKTTTLICVVQCVCVCVCCVRMDSNGMKSNKGRGSLHILLPAVCIFSTLSIRSVVLVLISQLPLNVWKYISSKTVVVLFLEEKKYLLFIYTSSRWICIDDGEIMEIIYFGFRIQLKHHFRSNEVGSHLKLNFHVQIELQRNK